MGSILNTVLFFFFLIPFESQNDSIINNATPKVLQEFFDETINLKQSDSEIEIEIDGLLVDDTKTKIGRDFYDRFYSIWEAPTGAKNYTITILEKPFRLTSTLVVIMINENVVYQSILQPRQDIVEQLVDQGIAYTYNYLQNYEEIMSQLNGEDQSGTGMF